MNYRQFTNLGTPFHQPRRAQQRGFTLLEVMVSVVILVIGVLGTAAMTLTAIRNGQQSGIRSTAVALAYEVSDMVRAYPGQVASFINLSTSSNPGALNAACFAAGCSEAQMAQNDVFEWARKVAANLPGGSAATCRDTANLTPSTSAAPNCDNLATSPLVVKVWWAEKNGDGSLAATNRPNITVAIRPN